MPPIRLCRKLRRLSSIVAEFVSALSARIARSVRMISRAKWICSSRKALRSSRFSRIFAKVRAHGRKTSCDSRS